MLVRLFSTEKMSVRPERLTQYPDRALTSLSVPVFAWQWPFAGPLRIRPARVPSRPAIGSEALKEEKPDRRRSARKRRATCLGAALSERDSPEPSARCTVTPSDFAYEVAARVPAFVVPVVDGSSAVAASGAAGVGVSVYAAPLRRSDPPDD